MCGLTLWILVILQVCAVITDVHNIFQLAYPTLCSKHAYAVSSTNLDRYEESHFPDFSKSKYRL